MSENSSADLAKPRPLRNRIHEIIFGAHTRAGLAFDLFLLVAIILSVIAISLETVKGEDGLNSWSGVLFYVKWFFTILFTIEYFLRIYCVKRPLKYIFSFWGIIDLLAILPDYVLLLPIFGGMSSRGFSVVRSLRLLRVFRIMNLSWFQYEAEELGGAIWRSRGKIVVFLMVVMIIVTVAGTVMYEVENAFAVDAEGNSIAQISSIPHGIYWAIVTMTTVGFGDVVPVTTGGMFISAILILVGYSLIIVPTGFVSAEVIDSRKKTSASTISCASCIREGHDNDAVYCKYCGEKL